MFFSLTYYLVIVSIVLFSLYMVEKSQIGDYLNVHKVFILLLIFLNIPIILIKPDLYINDPSINYKSLIHADKNLIIQGVKIFMISVFIYTLVPFIFRRFYHLKFINAKNKNYTTTNFYFNRFCFFIFILLLVMSIINIDYRLSVLRYLLGNIDPISSNILRRFGNNDFFLINYFRYSLVLIHIIMFSIVVKKKFGDLAFTIIYIFSVVLISGSVSKLYYVHALAIYGVVFTYYSNRKNLLENKYVYLKFFIFFIVLILFLSMFFSSIQYAQLSFFDGLKASIYRTYSAWLNFLYFIYIFPDYSDFTYFHQSSFLGSIFGFEPVRIGDILVNFHPRLYQFYTSLVTNYIGYAWAFGGYFAVITFSVLLSLLLKYLDVMHYYIKNDIIRVTFYSFIICSPISNMHSSFFSSLLHYGMLSAPLYLIILDKIFDIKKK